MTNVMEDSETTTVADPDSAAAENWFQVDRQDRLADSGWPDGQVFERCPLSDVPTSLSHTSTYVYYYRDEKGPGEGYRGAVTHRPIYWLANGSWIRWVDRPEGWHWRRFLDRLAAATPGWSAARKALAELAFMRHVFPALPVPSEEIAGNLGVSAVRAFWPDWSGMRTHDLIGTLTRDLNASDWRPKPEPDIATFAARILGEPTDSTTRTVQQRFAAAVGRMIDSGFQPEPGTDLVAALNDDLTAAGYYPMEEDTTNLVAFLKATFPLASPDVPEDIAAMTEDEVRVAFTQLRARTQRTIEALWKHAEDRGMCSEFDRIMLRSGWPARPKDYAVYYELSYYQDVTAEELNAIIPAAYASLSFDGTVKRKVSYSSYWTVKLGSRPTKTVAEKALAEVLDQLRSRHGVPSSVTDLAWSVTSIG